MTIFKRLLVVAAFFTMTAQSGLNGAQAPEIDEIYANIARFTYTLQRINGVDESWQAVATWVVSMMRHGGNYRDLILIDVVISSDSSLDDKVARLHKVKERHEQGWQEWREEYRQNDAERTQRWEAKRLQAHRLDEIDYIKRHAIATVSVILMVFLGTVGGRLANRFMDAVLV